MIRKCDKRDKRTVLSYIGDHYSSCLYLYLNLKKYGIESNNIDVYIHTIDDSIKAIMLKYYSCIHIYSFDNLFDAVELGEFIDCNHFSMVYCTANTASLIFEALPDKIREVSSITKGWVAQINSVDKKPKGMATLALDSDFNQIVQLIYEDEDIGRSYKYDELAQQLKERNHSGYTRNIVIKDGNLVIAHACTNAEMENISVVAELLVHKNYRRKGYASEIWRDLCERLLQEQKEVYSFYYSKESRALHKKIGFIEICEWGKIVIHNDSNEN